MDSKEFKVLQTLKHRGQGDTYALATRVGDQEPDMSEWVNRFVVLEGLALVERIDDDTQWGSTEWAITREGLWFLDKEKV